MIKAYRFDLSRRAETDLGKLEKTIAKRILAKLDYYVHMKNPLVFAKKINNRRTGNYRF